MWVKIMAHRAAWAHYYGEWPELTLDHINGVRNDNRIENLRVAGNSINAKNLKMHRRNTTGATGVYRVRRSSRWLAQITADKKYIYLGRFDTFEEAVAARREAEAKYGFTARHGLPQPAS